MPDFGCEEAAGVTKVPVRLLCRDTLFCRSCCFTIKFMDRSLSDVKQLNSTEDNSGVILFYIA